VRHLWCALTSRGAWVGLALHASRVWMGSKHVTWHRTADCCRCRGPGVFSACDMPCNVIGSGKGLACSLCSAMCVLGNDS
jgi:hypothetical protein